MKNSNNTTDLHSFYLSNSIVETDENENCHQSASKTIKITAILTRDFFMHAEEVSFYTYLILIIALCGFVSFFLLW